MFSWISVYRFKVNFSSFSPPSTNSMWTADANDVKCLESYPSLIEKDQQTKGSFEKDYVSYCESNSIIKCPYISGYTITGSDNEGVRVSNCLLDLPNWRSMLLSLCTSGSKVMEVSIHACRLSLQHIDDLTKALLKSGLLKSLKIQFTDIFSQNDGPSSVISTLKALLNDSTNLEYLSLKGTNLSDEIVTGFSPALTENFRLCGLNLSSNFITSDGCTNLLTAIKMNTSLRVLNFSENLITNPVSVTTIINQSFCSAPTGTEDGIIKANMKIIAEKNKAIKEINKKRKKAGLAEFAEIPALPDLMKAVEGKNWFVNRTLECVDLSANNITADDQKQFIPVLGSIPSSLLTESNLKVFLDNKDPTLVEKFSSIFP
jgi:hypothetical protein